jgi:hypothetical protein
VTADAAHDPIVVTSVNGHVERRQGDAWTPIVAGAVLDSHDVVRTADHGSAAIAISTHVEVTLGGTQPSELELGAPLHVASGQLSADVRPGGGSFATTFGDAHARAETADGAFAGVADRAGGVTVGSLRGTTRVTAHGRGVDVPADMQSSIGPDGPTAPRAVPSSLFLKVTVGARGRDTEIRGRTSPGALLSIDGVAFAVDADGDFRGSVPGTPQRVRVDAMDVVGRVERRVVKVPRARDVTGTVTF